MVLLLDCNSPGSIPGTFIRGSHAPATSLVTAAENNHLGGGKEAQSMKFNKEVQDGNRGYDWRTPQPIATSHSAMPRYSPILGRTDRLKMWSAVQRLTAATTAGAIGW